MSATPSTKNKREKALHFLMVKIFHRIVNPLNKKVKELNKREMMMLLRQILRDKKDNLNSKDYSLDSSVK